MVKMKYAKLLLKSTLIVAAIVALTLTKTQQAHAAACTAPATSLGSVTASVTIPSNGDYTIWSRIMAADPVNNSYALEVDGTTCYTVGDSSSLAANTWTWVNYQNGSTTNVIRPTLSAGSHTLKLIGVEPNVKVDRLLFLADATCTPNNDGSNCLVNVDQTPPTASITAPTNGSTVSGTVNIQATATDDTAVTKVELYIDNTLVKTFTGSPYNYSWDTTKAAAGSHSIVVKAYDAAGNVGPATTTVTVQNQTSDTQAPTAPSNLTAAASAYNKVTLNWGASTDNVGVTSYTVIRNGTPVAKVNNVTTYTDTTVLPQTQYTYQVTASDAAGNTSAASNSAAVTTPNTADTQAPSVPANVKASAVSTSQINVSWTASTDNVGVAGYDVYRSTGSASFSKIATVTTTSYGDTGLTSGTTYKYYVTAHDAAGNNSANSSTVQATTQKATKGRGGVQGKITGSNGALPTRANIVLWHGSYSVAMKADPGNTYSLESLAGPSTYTLVISEKGYKTQSVPVNIVAGQIITKNVTLQAQ